LPRWLTTGAVQRAALGPPETAAAGGCAIKVFNGQLLNLCELDYWDGTVLNVAHSMFPVCMEIMYVLVHHDASMRGLEGMELQGPASRRTESDTGCIKKKPEGVRGSRMKSITVHHVESFSIEFARKSSLQYIAVIRSTIAINLTRSRAIGPS
jgi:hypothetical protein